MRIGPQDWLEIDQLEAIAATVSNDLGISIAPDWAPPWPDGVRVARLPLPGDVPPREIGISGNAALRPRVSPHCCSSPCSAK
jgi:DNA-binding transcriptional LysR family regulator